MLIPPYSSGVPWGIRTLDLLLRRQLLYPTELKAHQRSNSTLLPAFAQEAKSFVERVMGIEPTRPAWKAGILPLNYTRIPCDGLSNRYFRIIPYFFLFVKRFPKFLPSKIYIFPFPLAFCPEICYNRVVGKTLGQRPKVFPPPSHYRRLKCSGY